MSYGMYMSAVGADAQSRRLEVITHNLVNANTPGFKREIAILQARNSEAIEQDLAQSGSKTINDLSGGLTVRETVTQFGKATMKPTGRKTDLAIAAKDIFFQVDKDGEQLLTRAGNFQLSRDGRMTTEQGFQVLSSGGEPITIDPNSPYEIFKDGRISQDSGSVALGLVEPQSLGDLARVGQNLFRPLAPVKNLVEPSERPDVLSGYLEGSGVEPTAEMMEMIQASRAYEANVKMIQNHDHIMGALIGRVLQA